MRRIPKRARVVLVLLAAAIAAAAVSAFLTHGKPASASAARSEIALGHIPAGLIRGHIADAVLRSGREHGGQSLDPDGGAGVRGQAASAEQQTYANAAYPLPAVGFAQVLGAQRANSRIDAKTALVKNSWQELGPFTLNVDALGTQTGNRPTQWSGRVTALSIDPRHCGASSCRVYVAAAGGGIWRSNNALASNPQWDFISGDIPSTSIGSLLVDPTDRSGRTLYAGTGEESGSSDSEAGVGLYKSTNGGQSWSLVPGSLAVANSNSIGAVAVDPSNPSHIWIGTDSARHGASSVNGGRFTPPNHPLFGLYESTNGGATFTANTIKPQDVVDPTSPNGSDFERGGVTTIQYDPTHRSVVYFSMIGYGVFRSVNNGSSFARIYTSTDPGNPFGIRYEFATTTLPNGKTRMYLADGRDEAFDNNGNMIDASRLFRVDDALKPASSLTNDDDNNPQNAGWISLTSSNPADPRFATFDFCEAQCSYDMWVATPPGRPNEVWLGGSMHYEDLPPYAGPDKSDGRAVVRSTNTGETWTDMTGDARPDFEDQHPDTRDVAFVPGTHTVAFVASDGGVIRTSGTFSDASSQCDTRGLSGTDLSNCHAWLSGVPTRLITVNSGLRTLQFESLTPNPNNPLNDVIGGTQDNSTMKYDGTNTWSSTVSGDGGNSGIDVGNPNLRYHTYYSDQADVNFHNWDPLHWDWMMDPLLYSGEAASFYVPFIADPVVAGTAYTGANHVWRTKDGGGDPTFLDNHCYTNGLGTPRGDALFSGACGDWVMLGNKLDSTDFGATRAGTDGSNYVAQTTRAPSDSGTLWAATRLGRVFVTKNADASGPLTDVPDAFGAGVTLHEQAQVVWNRIDDGESAHPVTPQRFVSGIAVDPSDANHAIVSYSGYDAYATLAGTPTGHVFDVHYNPTTHASTWTNITHDLGDQPITNVEFDAKTGDVYASTDFGVDRLAAGTTSWVPAADGLPPVAVYDISLVNGANGTRILYAATHGRGGWRLILP